MPQRKSAGALVMLSVCACLWAHGGVEHRSGDSSLLTKTAVVSQLPDTGVVGVDPKLGAFIPLDCSFTTDEGKIVTLRDVVQGPTVVCMVYYHCTDACAMLTMGLANALRSFAKDSSLAPNVITISVDENDRPADARTAKEMAFAVLQVPYPKDRWTFLCGSTEQIRSISNAIGYRFARKQGEIVHPMALVVISPKGKVVRYIMGSDYLPMDIKMSLMEATSGTVQPTIARVLRLCFSYDPKSRQYVFKILRVSAVVVFSLIGSFVLYLVLSTRSRRKRGAPS